MRYAPPPARRIRNYGGFARNPVLIIIAVNILFFIATIISRNLVSLFGLVPAFFFDRPWTIVTNLFIHAGLWHLFGNMMTLHFFGTSLSKFIGERRFLMVYFGGGILGNIFYLLMGIPLSIAVGASGAVFAVAGALVMMAPKLRVIIFPIPAPIPLWAAVIGGFLILSFLPFVAWEAHLGGLIFGLIAGYFVKKGGRHYY